MRDVRHAICGHREGRSGGRSRAGERLVSVRVRSERTVYTGPRLLSAIPRPPERVAGQDLISVTQTRNPVSPKTVQKAIQGYGRRAGIEGVRCSPHTFGHMFATWWLRNGGDVFTLHRVLRHPSLEMVKRWLSLSTDDLQAAHRRWPPVDALR